MCGNTEYEYARQLAVYIWERDFKESAPDWEPLPDMFGVLSQIDNMIASKSDKLINSAADALAIIKSVEYDNPLSLENAEDARYIWPERWSQVKARLDFCGIYDESPDRR